MYRIISVPLCKGIETNEGSLKLSVSISVRTDKNNATIMKSANDRGDYITIEPNPKLVIKLYQKNIPWSLNQQISVTQRDMFELYYTLSTFYKKIQKGRNYIYDQSGLLKEVVKDRSDISIFHCSEQRLILEPALLEIRDKNRYGGVATQCNLPGIQFTINTPENITIVSMNEFELILNMVKELNLPQMGLQLLQIYINMTRNTTSITSVKEEEPKQKKQHESVSMFADAKSESVSGPLIKPKVTSLFDL